MDPTLILGGINAALTLLEQFAPALQAMVKNGEVSVEQQAVVLARIELIRSGKFFDQPQWQVPPEVIPPLVIPPSGAGQ